jgi:uridine kinase
MWQMKFSRILFDRFGNSKFPNFNNFGFWIGLAFKLFLGCMLASDYMRKLFAPFVNDYLLNGHDPYAHFQLHGHGNEFPYPPLMLWILSLGRLMTWPLENFDPANFGVADLLGFRLPLLFADFAIYIVLCRWFKTRQKEVLYWYWLSPIAIYINYVHGQLDAIPTALLFVSLHFVFRRKWNLSALFLALAMGTKTHMVLVLPFYAWYIFRNTEDERRKLILPTLIIGGLSILINAVFYSQEYLSMVYNNRVQTQIYDLYYQFNTQLQFLFIPSVLLILAGSYFTLKFVNKDQLLLFIGFTFVTLTLMIAPMQGWYYWVLPYLIFFIIRHGSKIEASVFVVLNICYFLYFIFIPDSDLGRLLNSSYRNIYDCMGDYNFDNKKILNLIFTFMQTALLVLAWLIYRGGIKQNIQKKFLSQPYLVGIGGDSASGKTTLSNAILAIFGERNTNVVRGDDMHKWERGNTNWQNYTHLNPEANMLHENLQHSLSLKRGKSVRRRHYDHDTGKFTLPQFIRPKKLVVFEGLHSFFLQNQSDVYDLKIFMAPSEDLREFWKIKRDVVNRGYSEEKVISQIESRKQDSEKFIQSQSSMADLLFRFYPVDQIPVDRSLKVDVGLSVTLNNNIFIDPALRLIEESVTMTVTRNYEGDKRVIRFEGNLSNENIDRIGVDLLPELEEVGVYEPEWQSDYSGVMQLITIYVMFNTLTLDES